MDVFTAIRQRSSVRTYKSTDAEEDKLKKILEAASPRIPDEFLLTFPVRFYRLLRNFSPVSFSG
jgi:hypothetical protein